MNEPYILNNLNTQIIIFAVMSLFLIINTFGLLYFLVFPEKIGKNCILPSGLEIGYKLYLYTNYDPKTNTNKQQSYSVFYKICNLPLNFFGLTNYKKRIVSYQVG
jgi:hypothetical protein